MISTDTVIVGGGSAGCVLAARLSEDPNRQVLLLEAGPDYGIALPDALTNPNTLDDGHDWGYSLRRGKVLGGSSATNAAVAILPRASDFDRWRRHGIESWSTNQIRPSIERMRNTFPIQQPSVDSLTPGCQAFIASATGCGFPLIADFNGAEQFGVGTQPRNVVRGVKVNAASAYLDERVRARKNLTIRANVEIDRVLWQGTRAIGVAATHGESILAGEIVLAAGVFGSPAILLRSGMPVGEGLIDHPMVSMSFALRAPAKSMVPAVGALLWTHSQSADPGDQDLQIIATHFGDVSASPTGAILSVSAAVTMPHSRGSVTLVSRDPQHAPQIDCNFLHDERDRTRMLEAIDLARKIVKTPPLSDLIEAELSPGTIESNLRSYHHAVGTVPMGRTSDEQGRVLGVEGLSVADASIFPEIPSAPPHLAVLIVAEEIARRMK